MRRRLRLVWAVVLVAVSVYLYYRPLSSYFETKRELQSQRAQVAALSKTKDQLEQRLTSFTTPEATREEARRIGYVRPGEQLFILKGIAAWREARRSLRSHG